MPPLQEDNTTPGTVLIMTGDYCPDCTYRTWEAILPGNNGLCLWELCTYCGTAARVME